MAIHFIERKTKINIVCVIVNHFPLFCLCWKKRKRGQNQLMNFLSNDLFPSIFFFSSHMCLEAIRPSISVHVCPLLYPQERRYSLILYGLSTNRLLLPSIPKTLSSNYTQRTEKCLLLSLFLFRYPYLGSIATSLCFP